MRLSNCELLLTPHIHIRRTIGFGDFSPNTVAGKILVLPVSRPSILSSALPTSLLTLHASSVVRNRYDLPTRKRSLDHRAVLLRKAK